MKPQRNQSLGPGAFKRDFAALSPGGLSLDDHLKKEKALARELRRSAWWLRKKQNDHCYYCLQKPAFDDVTMDHIVPLSTGGKTNKNNIVVACKKCNTEKKDQLIWDYSGFK